MKKLYVSLIVAIGLCFVMASLSTAATIKPSATFTVSAEMLGKTRTEYLGSGTLQPGKTVKLQYTPSFDMNDGDKLWFQLTNASFSKHNYYLLKLGATTVQVGSQFTSVATTNVIGIRLSTANTVLKQGNTWTLSESGTKLLGPEIVVPAGLANGAVIKLAVTDAKDVGGTSLPGAKAGATKIGAVSNQFNLTAAGVTSTINVNKERKLFVTSTKLSKSTLTWTDKAGIDDKITIGTADKLAFTVTPSTDFTGVKSVKFAGSTLTIDTTNNEATRTVTGDNMASGALAIEVDGTTVLDTRTFDTSVALDFNNSQYADETYNLGTTHTWNMNGWQGVVSYMNPSDDYKTFVKISNLSSTQTANVTVDVTTDSGTSYDTVTLEQIPPNSTKIYKASDVVQSLGITEPFTAQFTVTVPAAQVAAVAIMKTPGEGQRVLPIYSGTNGAMHY